MAVRVVAMCCGAVGGRRMHTRLALGGWHCSGWSLVLSTGRCDHCWEGVICGGDFLDNRMSSLFVGRCHALQEIPNDGGLLAAHQFYQWV